MSSKLGLSKASSASPTMAIALQFRSRFITPRNQSLLRHFSSSSTPGFNEGADDDDDNKKEPKPSSFSSHFSDVKASLKQTPPPPRKIAPPPPLSSERPSFSQLTPPKVASLDEIRKNISEFRRRSAPPHPGDNYSSRSSADKPISFQELYKRNVAAEGEQGKTNALGGNKSGNISLDAIRENLRQLKLNQTQGSRGPNDRVSSTKVVNPFSLKSFKETLKMKPDEPGTGFSGPVGGMNQLPNVVFGKEEKMKMDTESTSTKTDFVKTYDYGELGKKLQKLRSTGSKGGFSLHELNDRLRKLREVEEKEMESTIHGVSFRDLRESLVKLRSSSDDKTKRSTMQRFDILSNLGGGTPTFMLSPPKEQLVEQYFHPDNLSSEEKLKLELKKVRDEFKMSESDCGSSRVQVAQLTTKIKHLSSVLHKKDKHSRKGLIAMVQKRKKLLKYLRRTDWDSYCFVISKLGLRDNPDYKH